MYKGVHAPVQDGDLSVPQHISAFDQVVKLCIYIQDTSLVININSLFSRNAEVYSFTVFNAGKSHQSNNE